MDESTYVEILYLIDKLFLLLSCVVEVELYLLENGLVLQIPIVLLELVKLLFD
jgi:hypothetical protein